MPLSDQHRRELIAIVALLAGLFVGLALLPLEFTGPVGRVLGSVLKTGLGAGAAVLPVFGIIAGLVGFGWLPAIDLRRLGILGAGLVFLVPYVIGVGAGVRSGTDFAAAWTDWTLAQKLVGVLPGMIVVGVRSVVGLAGAVVLGLVALSGLTLVTVDWHPFRRLTSDRGTGGLAVGRLGGSRRLTQAAREVEDEDDDDAGELEQLRVRKARRTTAKVATPQSDRPTAQPPIRRRAEDGVELDELPPIDLLDAPPREAVDAGEAELDRLGRVLIETLGTFRVEGTVVGRTTGPVVTQYEVAPGSGVKVNRIAALADDLALAMRAQSIRIVAPIPGKAAVGIEVPNPTARIVKVRELIEAHEWERARGALPIVLGRDLEGKPIVTDLAKMPHLLIAGATGSGKSVCINTIITSLVYRYAPRQLRLLMIDPKMVELSGYNALPHLRHPVVTNNKDAAKTLKWAVYEMEHRYALFHANGARNIADFNRKVADEKELVEPAVTRLEASGGRLTASEQGELPLTASQPYTEGPLPYVILIVDELADLMMTVQGEVEKPLAILAQKARATGVHLLLATQRPSVNVITGLIKANFPSRIAFRVASKVDSRTILDQNGAEALLGNGDMLFLPPGKSEPVRLQGAFISTDETERLTGWYADQKAERDAALASQGLLPPETGEADILDVVAAREMVEEGADATGVAEAAGERDALFREAAELCIQHQLGSTSLLQRKLRIGYGRAARIVDQLHEAGILGPPDGSKPREVLIGGGQLDEYCGE
ncbi:MAG: DNA translocase FtsK [Gemmatimonadota bacterium]|nr:DNA translocase FtsK [Gemmatimonadota bacterium]